MPYKFHASRRHHIPKARYRVTNWPDHDRDLVRPAISVSGLTKAFWRSGSPPNDGHLAVNGGLRKWRFPFAACRRGPPMSHRASPGSAASFYGSTSPGSKTKPHGPNQLGEPGNRQVRQVPARGDHGRNRLFQGSLEGLAPVCGFHLAHFHLPDFLHRRSIPGFERIPAAPLHHN